MSVHKTPPRDGRVCAELPSEVPVSNRFALYAFAATAAIVLLLS